MLGMGRDHGRQGEAQRSRDIKARQKVDLSGWAREDQQGFVVCVKLSRHETGGP